MTTWKCPKLDCDYSIAIGMSIGTPTCPKHNIVLVESGKLGEISVQNSNKLHIAASVNIGGNLTNSGKIKIYDNGTLNIKKDLLNSGDLIVNDPEKIKELLIQTVRTTGSVAELGTAILKNFFNI